MNYAPAGIGVPLIVGSFGSAVAVVGGAFALGLRHGIDWDHIAAITDITSTSLTSMDSRDVGLVVEPGVQLTDESHHELHTAEIQPLGAHTTRAPIARAGGSGTALAKATTHRVPPALREAFTLATLYALGHGAMVALLGATAILAAGLLPSWIDPVMGRVVGVTLLVLAGYLYFSVYRYFRGDEFAIRSRWMLIFALVRGAYHRTQARRYGHSHLRPETPARYGPRSAFGIGLVHGVGAETGTQVLIIAAAAGASRQAEGLVALTSFVGGLLVANSAVTLMTSLGFASAQRRAGLYVAAGLLAATFSLVLGLLFLSSEDGLLPDLSALLAAS